MKYLLVPMLVFDVDALIGKDALLTVLISDSFGVEAEASVRLKLIRQ